MAGDVVSQGGSEDETVSASAPSCASSSQIQGRGRGRGRGQDRLGLAVGPGTAQQKERLQRSIAKVQGQIDETKRALDNVCEELRNTTAANTDIGPGEEISANGASMSSRAEQPEQRKSEQEIIKQARDAVNAHIKMLTRYNELRDVAMGLLGMIAEYEGVRLADVMRARGVLDDEDE